MSSRDPSHIKGAYEIIGKWKQLEWKGEGKVGVEYSHEQTMEYDLEMMEEEGDEVDIGNLVLQILEESF